MVSVLPINREKTEYLVNKAIQEDSFWEEFKYIENYFAKKIVDKNLEKNIPRISMSELVSEFLKRNGIDITTVQVAPFTIILRKIARVELGLM